MRWCTWSGCQGVMHLLAVRYSDIANFISVSISCALKMDESNSKKHMKAEHKQIMYCSLTIILFLKLYS